MIRNERLHVPEEGYKRGGKVKGKKKAKGKAKRKVTGKAKRGKKVVLPPLTTGSMGIGQGSYQATVQPSGGAFQAPSYFRAVGSSDNYASVPPVLREFVKQQEKMWEDLKKGKTTVDGTPMADVSKATRVASSSSSSTTPSAPPTKIKMSKAELMEKLRVIREKKAREEAPKAESKDEDGEEEAVVGGSGLPYAFPPASGDVIKPTDTMIDAPSSSYAPLLASPPDDLSKSASASSAVASSASSAVASSASSERRRSVSPQASEEEEEEEESGEEAGAGGAPLIQPVVTESMMVKTARHYEDTKRIDSLTGDSLTSLATSLGIQTSKKEGGVKKRIYSSADLRDVLKERVLSLLTGGSQAKIGGRPLVPANPVSMRRPIVPANPASLGRGLVPAKASSSSSSSSSSGAF